MPESAVRIDGFSVGYGPCEVLHDISLSVAAGEYLAIIGPNGVGKSTLLKSINRITQGGSGTIELFGKDLVAHSQRDLGRMVGYVPQYHEQAFSYSVFEFVLMARFPYFNRMFSATKSDEQKVLETLELIGLTDFIHRRIDRLSGGEKQKVYLAAALAQEPKILLLDEPTAHLDPRYHSEIQQLILKVSREQKMAVLHVTHDLNHIFLWSQKVLALKKGRALFCGATKDVMTKENLRQVFDTDFLFIEHPQTHQRIIVPEMVS